MPRSHATRRSFRSPPRSKTSSSPVRPGRSSLFVHELTRPSVGVGVGDADAMTSLDQAKQIKEILESKKGGQVTIYPEACHGFAIRGDQNNDEEKKLKEQVFEQAVSVRPPSLHPSTLQS